MKEAFKNKKIKRILSSFLVVVILISSFATWGISDVKAADSNDRRRTVIKLAQGAQLTEMEELQDMSYDDLRLFALYLSNYYIPFSTKFDQTSLESADNKALVESMTKALAEDVGLDESLANYMASMSMQSTIQTAHQLYVPYDALKAIKLQFAISGYDNNGLDDDQTAWKNSYWDTASYLGTATDNVEQSGGFYANIGTIGRAVYDSQKRSVMGYTDLPAYASYLETITGGAKTTKDGVRYIPVSYSTFLQLFNLSKRISRWDSTQQGYYCSKDTSTKFQNLSGIKSNSSYLANENTYVVGMTSDGAIFRNYLFNYTDAQGNYTYRYLRNLNTAKARPILYGGTDSYMNNLYNLAETCYIPLVWIDDAGETHVVFSNNESCLNALTLVYQTVNFEYGYGCAFTPVYPSELGSYSAETIRDYMTAYTAMMYTDWVGNICMWNGVCYQVVIPAVNNPYTFSELTDYEGDDYGDKITYEERQQAAADMKIESFQGNKVPLINFISLSLNSSIKTKTYTYNNSDMPKDSENYSHIEFYDSNYSKGYSLFRLNYWRVGIGVKGEDNYDFDADAAIGSGWGKYQKIADAFELSGDIFTIDAAEGSSDYMVFPSFHKIYDSQMYSDVCTNFGTRRNMLMIVYDDDDDWSDPEYGVRWITHDGILSEDNYMLDDFDTDTTVEHPWERRCCSQFENGYAGSLQYCIYTDNIAGIGNSTDLSTFFKYHDCFGSAIDLRGKIDLDFKAVQKEKAEDSANFFTGTINKYLAQSLFLTYAFAYYNGAYYEGGGYDKEAHIINLRYNAELFPTGTGRLDFSQVVPTEDTTEEEVLSMVYYLLHPSEGISYFATWIKNKAGGLFIGWHEDIVGSSDSNSSLGMTQYLGTSGYTTTPNLSDIAWIESLLDAYDNIIVYILIILAVIMLCYIILGQLSVQRAVIGFIMFGVCAFLPPYIMNFTINTSNNISDRIFTEKFDYWALVQTEEYLGQLQSYHDVDTAGDSSEVFAELVAMKTKGSGQASETSYGSMRVKWISPKKYSDLAELTEALNSKTSSNLLVKNASDNMKSLVISSIASTTSGEDFSGADGLYLYRDILDIYRAGAITYNVMAQQSNSTISHGTINSDASNYLNLANMSTTASITCLAQSSYKEGEKILGADKLPDYYSLINYDSNGLDDTGDVDNFISSFSAVQNGFIPHTTAATNTSQNYYTSQNLASTYLASYHNKYLEIYDYYCDNISGSGTVDISWYATITWDDFKKELFANPDLSAFNYGTGHITSAITGTAADGKAPTEVITTGANLDALYYAMYSESPYYFLNYQIRDVLRADGLYAYDMLNPTGIKNGGTTNGLVTLFLKDNQDYFYNYTNNDGYGELRDYMNMHDFFYLVIPSLRANADIIRWFDAQYTFNTHDTCSLRRQMDGSFKYDGITIIKSDGTWNTSEVGEFKDWYGALNEQERYEFWHDLNVNLLCYYSCTWLDAMLDCDYAKSETIKVGADKYTVEEPLNPYSYFETDSSGNIIKGRPMIFSRSEMQYYGLQEHNLTTVEKKIIELNDNVYKKSLDLTNYYTLSDETLIHAYSMICLFEFNNIFSDTDPFGEDYVLYPLGYELKAVTYDGYLRLMLYASSGEDLMYKDADGNKSIYTRIQEKTSIFFGIGLVINDLFAVYALPALKLFFLILLFMTSILIIIAGAIKLDLNLTNVIWKSLLAPMLSFMGVTVGLSIVSSLFMSNGASGVYESAPVIALGDPTALILVQLVINIVVLILYWKMLKKAFKDFKTYVTSVFNDIAGAVTGAVGKIAGVAAGAHVVNKLSKGAKDRGTANTGGSSGGSGVALAAGLGAAGGAAMTASKAEANSQEAREKAAADQKAYNDKATADKQAKQDAKIAKAENKALDKADKLNDKADKASSKADNIDKQQKKLYAQKNKIKNNDKLTAEQKEKAEAKRVKQLDKLKNKKAKLKAKSSSLSEKSASTLDAGITRSEKMRQKAQANNAKLDARNAKRNAKIDRNITKQAHKSTQRQAKLATKEAKLARRDLSTPRKVIKTAGRACKNLVKRRK